MLDIDQLAVKTLVSNHFKPNFVLYYEVDTGATILDSVGNPKRTGQEQMIKASLREDTRQRQESTVPLVKSIPLIGRLTEPLILPVAINTKKRYRAIYKNKQGEFEFNLDVQNRSGAYTAVRGDSIQGVFVEIN